MSEKDSSQDNNSSGSIDLINDKTNAPARTISDVVIGLENKIDLLVKVTYGNDINSKLMLDRLNRISKSLEKLVTLTETGNAAAINTVREVVSVSTNQENDFPSFQPQTGNSEVLVQNEEPGFSMTVETNPTGVRRTARPETYEPVEQTKKVTPVFQRVFDESGKKMIFMADVEILSGEDRSLVLKTRTTATGKWQAPLSPGRYIVNIMKRENAGRKRLEYTNSFEIKESNVPVEIEAAKLV